MPKYETWNTFYRITWEVNTVYLYLKAKYISSFKVQLFVMLCKVQLFVYVCLCLLCLGNDVRYSRTYLTVKFNTT